MLRFKKYKVKNKLTDEEFIDLVEQFNKLEKKILKDGSDEQRRKYYEKDDEEEDTKSSILPKSRRRSTKRKNKT